MKINQHTVSMAMILSLMVGGTSLWAAESATTNTETKVLSELRKANAKEIALGKLAEEKGATSDIRDYGKMLAADHQKADDKVDDVARTQSISLPAANVQNDRDIAKLQAMEGAAFDTAFLKDMKRDHDKDISKLQMDESKLPTSSPVRRLVAQLLPTLEKHRDKAVELMNTSSAG